MNGRLGNWVLIWKHNWVIWRLFTRADTWPWSLGCPLQSNEITQSYLVIWILLANESKGIPELIYSAVFVKWNKCNWINRGIILPSWQINAVGYCSEVIMLMVGVMRYIKAFGSACASQNPQPTYPLPSYGEWDTGIPFGLGPLCRVRGRAVESSGSIGIWRFLASQFHFTVSLKSHTWHPFLSTCKHILRCNTADLSAVLHTSDPEEMYLLKTGFELAVGHC